MPRKAYLALYLLFFAQPLAWGGWLVRISEIQQKLSLSPASLSTAIVAVPVGLMLSLIFAGRLYERWGVKRMTAISMVIFLLAILLPALAVSWSALFLALFFVGTGLAMAELGLNVVASFIEANGGRHIMGTAHGFWSLGLLVGSMVSAGLSWIGVDAFTASLSLSALSAALCLWVFQKLPSLKAEKTISKNEKTQKYSSWPQWTTLAICFFAFGIALGEGAMADWAAVFMTEVHGVPLGTEGLGFVVYAFSIACGRFMLDAIRKHLGLTAIGLGSCVVALVGALGLMFSGTALMSYISFSLVGFGLATGFPMAVTAVAKQRERSAETNVALLSQVTLGGQLLGPLIIGLSAEILTMQKSFIVLIPCFVLSLWLSRHLSPRPQFD
jgi:MFS family permease